MTADDTLSPLDRLVACEAIRQQIARYPLLADGDGIRPRDPRALADRLMTPEVRVEVFRAGQSEPIRMQGRDAIAGPRIEAPPAQPPLARHYMVETCFEELSARAARTITTALHIRLEEAPADRSDGLPAKVTMSTYHMTWARTDEGWQIAHMTLVTDN